jgi:hypothetical protein
LHLGGSRADRRAASPQDPHAHRPFWTASRSLPAMSPFAPMISIASSCSRFSNKLCMRRVTDDSAPGSSPRSTAESTRRLFRCSSRTEVSRRASSWRMIGSPIRPESRSV